MCRHAASRLFFDESIDAEIQKSPDLPDFQSSRCGRPDLIGIKSRLQRADFPIFQLMRMPPCAYVSPDSGAQGGPPTRHFSTTSP